MIALIMWNLKKKKSLSLKIQKTDWWFSEVGGEGLNEMSECGKKVHISS